MKKKLLLVFSLMGAAMLSQAQTKIGGAAGAANTNAFLQLGDANASKGLLLSRVALTSTTSFAPLTAHVAGMHVYNTANAGAGATAVTPGEYYNDGTQWIRVATATNALSIVGSFAPVTVEAAGTIYTDTARYLANDWVARNPNPTFGQQWTYSGSAWVASIAPNTTEWYSAGGVNDAGRDKDGAIYRNGRVGIGTTTPTATLHVNNGVGTTQPLLLEGTTRTFATLRVNAAAGVDASSNIQFDRPNYAGITGTWLGGLSLNNPSGFAGGISLAASQNQSATTMGNSVVFYTHPNGNGAVAERMRINQNGAVGIGTANPIHPLHVNGTALFNDGAGLPAWNSLAMGQNPTNGVEIFNGGIWAQHATDANLYLTKPGNATNGSYAVFVRDGAIIGSINTNGTNNGVLYIENSDLRLKENIIPTTHGLNDVMNIGVRDYNFKSDGTKTERTGFIAQDLYKICPQAVKVGGDDVKTDPWGVDYSKVVPMLTKAIQEQQAQIEEMKKEIEQLKAGK